MSELWAEIMTWVASHDPGRLDQMDGLWCGETSDWNVEVNGHDGDVGDLPPFTIRLSHKKYLSLGIVHPSGGVLASADEGSLIAHFKSAQEPSNA